MPARPPPVRTDLPVEPDALSPSNPSLLSRILASPRNLLEKFTRRSTLSGMKRGPPPGSTRTNTPLQSHIDKYSSNLSNDGSKVSRSLPLSEDDDFFETSPSNENQSFYTFFKSVKDFTMEDTKKEFIG